SCRLRVYYREGTAIRAADRPRPQEGPVHVHPAPSTAEGRPSAPRVRRRNPWPGRAFQLVVAGVSAYVLFLSGTTYNIGHDLVSKTKRVDITKPLASTTRPAATKYGAMNLLLLGIDSRAGLTKEEIKRYHLGTDGLGGSDTIMLVHLSSKRDHATILSFPRDLFVTIPAMTLSDGTQQKEVQMKLNAAYARGHADGPSLTMATIEKLTNLHIDHYMSIDVPHLGRMVTALGGVEVCLPKAVNDTMFEGKPGGSGLVLSAGKHLLNDQEAVAYVRMRHVDTGEGVSDFGRIRRQQKFLSSMLRKVTSAGTLFHMDTLTKFLGTVSEAVTMDSQMSGSDLVTIAQQLQNLDPKHVTFVTVPSANDDYRVPGVGSTVLADEAGAQALYTSLRDDKSIVATDFASRPKTLDPKTVSVQVLNGGAPAGSGLKTANELAAMGFQSGGKPANAPTPADKTTIRYAGSQVAEARTVQRAVPTATLVQDDTATVVQLILAKDFTGTTPIPTSTATKPPKAVETHSAADDICTKN
ncbi:MAG: LytR family transcriptional regulator, partial [Frankiales bacterium]|nr:LytR family transcriptional regulator [Frankiales bacterium]